MEWCCRRGTPRSSPCWFLSGSTPVLHAADGEGERGATNRYCPADFISVCSNLLWHRSHRRGVQRHGCLLRAQKQDFRHIAKSPFLLPVQSPRQGSPGLPGPGNCLGLQSPGSALQPPEATQAGAPLSLRLAFLRLFPFL